VKVVHSVLRSKYFNETVAFGIKCLDAKIVANLKFPESHNALINFKSYSEKVLVLRQYSMNLLKFWILRLRINFKTASEMLI